MVCRPICVGGRAVAAESVVTTFQAVDVAILCRTAGINQVKARWAGDGLAVRNSWSASGCVVVGIPCRNCRRLTEVHIVYRRLVSQLLCSNGCDIVERRAPAYDVAAKPILGCVCAQKRSGKAPTTFGSLLSYLLWASFGGSSCSHVNIHGHRLQIRTSCTGPGPLQS